MSTRAYWWDVPPLCLSSTTLDTREGVRSRFLCFSDAFSPSLRLPRPPDAAVTCFSAFRLLASEAEGPGGGETGTFPGPCAPPPQWWLPPDLDRWPVPGPQSSREAVDLVCKAGQRISPAQAFGLWSRRQTKGAASEDGLAAS